MSSECAETSQFLSGLLQGIPEGHYLEIRAIEAAGKVLQHFYQVGAMRSVYYDLPEVRRLDGRARRWNGEGLTYEERLQRIVAEETDPPADSIFPVDSRWALEWDEVEEDSETARCLRENPEEWMSRRSTLLSELE